MRELPTRKPNRFKGHDYSQKGYYFITIGIKGRHELLWNQHPVGARIARPQLSDIGIIVEKAIENITQIYESIEIDKYVIMPTIFI